jgi:heat shock protein HtpX
MNIFNQTKTVILLAALTALFMAVGHVLGGRSGMIIALGMAAVMNMAAYWWSDTLVLTMYGARPLDSLHASPVRDIVQELCITIGIPEPRIYLFRSSIPNAFATGRNPEHGAVAVSRGLLDLLSRQELRGVLAHELGHIKNRDTLISTVVATLAGALSMLSNMALWGSLMGGGRPGDRDSEGHPLGVIFGVILAPLAAGLIQAAISRSREFMADQRGATFSGDPLALASALRKIEAGNARTRLASAYPSTAHLFIINPLRGDKIAGLFSTHPPTAERIRRLEAMASSRLKIAV